MRYKIFVSISLVISFIGLIIVGYYKGLELKDANSKIQFLNTQVDDATRIANNDCQMWIRNAQLVSRFEGCLQGVQLLCSKTNLPLTCSEKYEHLCAEELER
jgi:hypothetical protein